MNIYRLLTGKNKPWHIEDYLARNERVEMKSMCRNASVYLDSGVEFEEKPFFSTDKLCPSCVLKAFQLGLLTVSEKEF